MKNIRNRILSVVLTSGFGVRACRFGWAADASAVPAVVVNDINGNPIMNLSDGSKAFSFADCEADLLFTSGLSSNFAEFFTPEILKRIKNDMTNVSDIVMALLDYLGFSITPVDARLVLRVSAKLADSFYRQGGSNGEVSGETSL